MFSLARKLSAKGVLGLNRRNGDFILKYNKREFFPRVDDKLCTKRLAQAAGIAVPELYGVVESPGDVKRLPSMLAQHNDFVIKPARGSGGEGILVISGRPKQLYRKLSGGILSQNELNHYVFNALSGLYSLGGLPDQVIIEYRVRTDPVFKDISFQGVPDIRIIVFCGIPIMSMLRLPTQMSDGKANLHQGAIGAGIDIGTGKTLKAVWKNQVICEHPDTGVQVVGVTIPRWDQLLELASRSYQMTGLGYQGIDIVLDQNLGPLLLEINARPGLNIQIANSAGLLPRLELARKYLDDLKTTEHRVAFARERFAIQANTL